MIKILNILYKMHPHPLSTYGIFLKRLDEYEKDYPRMLGYLSYNPSLTAEIVRTHVPTGEGEWGWWGLMKNENILLHDIYEIIPENIRKYIYNTPESLNIYNTPELLNLNIETLLRYPNEKWDWIGLTNHKNITLQDILAHPELPWVLEELSSNPNIRLCDYIKYPNLPWKERVLFRNLSKTASFTDIMQFPNKPWIFEHYLRNKHHTKEELEELVLYTLVCPSYYYHYSGDNDPCWIWKLLCMNNRLTFADLYDMYLHLNKRLKKLIHTVPWLHKIKGTFPNCYIFKEQLINKNLRGETMTFVHPIQLFTGLSYNSNITGSDMDKYPFEDNKWDYELLSKNIKDLHYVFKNPQKNWHIWSIFIDNKNMTTELALRHKKIFVNVYGIEKFRYCFLKPDFLEPSWKEIREYFAKKKIIRILVEVISSPEYLWCRNRLTKEYTILKNDGVINL